MSDLIDSALARVVRWEDVPASWAGHRAEPLAAQRLWACAASAPSEEERRAGTARQVGIDAAGLPVIVGPAGAPAPWSAPPAWVDVVVRSEGEVAVHGLGRMQAHVAVTTFDAAGRVVRTTYGDGSPDESYIYGGDGQLVAIDESPGLTAMTRPAAQRPHARRWRDRRRPAGGAARRPWAEGDRGRARRHRGVDAPWPEALAELAAPLVDAVVAAVAGLGLPVATEAQALILDVLPAVWPKADVMVIVGTVAAREQALAELADDALALEEALWRPGNPFDEDRVTTAGIDDAAAERAAISAAAMHAAGDPRPRPTSWST